MSNGKHKGRKKNSKRQQRMLGDLSDNSDALSDTRTQVGSADPSIDGSFSAAAGGGVGGHSDFDEADDAPLSAADQARAALSDALGDLTERKRQTRVAALRELHGGLLKSMATEFLLKSHETVFASLTTCLRKGDGTEATASLGALATALLALASVEREHHEPKLVETAFASLVPLLERLLATHANSRVRSKAATVLALGSLVSGFDDHSETLRILDYLSSFWLTDSFTKKFQGNVKVRQKVIPAELSVATLDAWALLASSVEDRVVVDTLFPSAIRQIIRLLAHESLEVRIAAGRITALLFAAVYRHSGGGGSGDSDDSDDAGYGFAASAAAAGEALPEVTDDVIELLSELASDASKSVARTKRREQRNHFRRFLATVEAGESPEETLSLKGGRITFYGWRQLIQLAAIREALKTGFDLHMHNNLYLIELFEIENAFDNDQSFDDKLEREYRKRSRNDYKKSQRQRKNAFQYHSHD